MKLLSCPFCNTSNDEETVGLIITQSPETPDSPAFVVKCLGCGAWGPYGASNKDLAIEFWNRRVMVVITTATTQDVTISDL